MKNILVTGAFGLVGSDLVPALQKKYGKAHVFALGNKTIPKDFDGKLVKGDVRDVASLKKLLKHTQFLMFTIWQASCLSAEKKILIWHGT